MHDLSVSKTGGEFASGARTLKSRSRMVASAAIETSFSAKSMPASSKAIKSPLLLMGFQAF